MINGIVIKKLNKYQDNRGWLTEIWREDEDKYSPAMSYVSITLPGVARGPHEHVHQSDCFVFIGPGFFDLYLWDRRENSPTKGEFMKLEKIGEENPTAVIVPPGVVHGYKCMSEVPATCINLPDKLYKGENKTEEIDEIRWEKDENSIFKID